MEYLQVFALIFEFHRISDTLILRLDHTQDVRMTDDQPPFRDWILRLHGRSCPHFIVDMIAGEAMHRVESLSDHRQIHVCGK